jgi:hypothetical protein
MKQISLALKILKKKKPGQKVGCWDNYMVCLDENEKCAVSVVCKNRMSFREYFFQDFVKRVAQLAHGIKSDNWDDVKKMFPELEQERQLVEKVIDEDVKIDDIELMLI